MSTFTPDQAAAALANRRKPKPTKEQRDKVQKQRAKATQQALGALRDLHAEEHETLYAVALQEIQTEDSGPEVAV